MPFIIRTAYAAAAIFVLVPTTAAEAQPVPPKPLPLPTGPVLPLEYAAKFVCGRNGVAADPEPPSMAVGRYYTTVSIHNPNPSAQWTWKVSVAGLENPFRHSPFHPLSGLRYDESIDLDCISVRNWLAANGLTVTAAAPLLSGFVVIQANRELDVVAVYTAAPGSTPVATFSTEPVNPRKVM